MPHGARWLVYIVASRRRGMVYIGVTSHIAPRIDQHRRDVGSGYCRRYGIKTLVYAEHHDDIRDAIIRESS
ncbi:GIY-YIG nuclease family protein [Sphingomonas endolithica]|uniref:GIY-YIG nuclease family protein n=1 Tax=Sphingomonas endolithica TaxID=2972485 RepID=UPI00289CBC9F|nr:GIY-YIG nuclease family protein [Sphingomonas sp. ZFBP2030]